MLKLLIDNNATNKLTLPATADDFTAFCQILIDLNSGTKVLFSDFVAISSLFPEPVIKSHTSALFETGNLKYLIVEASAATSTTERAFDTLYSYLEPFIPTAYKESLSCALMGSSVNTIFNRKTLLLFQFKNNELDMVSSIPYYKSIEEYISNVSLREGLLTPEETSGLTELFSGNIPPSGMGSCYYSYQFNNNNKVSFFVRKNYFRINSIEINQSKVSVVFINKRGYLSGSYSANEAYTNLISAIINPSSLPATVSKAFLGNAILIANAAVSTTVTKQIHPVIIDTDTNRIGLTISIELSNEDTEFLAAIKNTDSSLIYTKHKSLLNLTDKEVRGCKSVYNASKTLKIVIRDGKKKLSDEEAYKNRIFRDYLSHAISLVAIPIFQKEFVVPECLQNHFVFKMAAVTGCWYKIGSNSRLRHSDRYFNIFDGSNKVAGWVSPNIPTIQVNKKAVASFVSDYKSMKLTSTTQTRSSIFTRQFVEPFSPSCPSSYSPPTEPAIFGWMMDIDNQEQNAWAYKLMGPHLLRSSSRGGHFYNECGLVSDKTFGVQSILSKVFVTDAFSEAGRDYSVHAGQRYLGKEKEPALMSAVLDIYSANFALSGNVEDAIRSNGTVAYSAEVARVNQLLFLSEPSLNILKSLYSCSTFEELSTCLDLCMPICLETLETLDYSKELKDHVSIMLNYFWETTKAISEELSSDTTKK